MKRLLIITDSIAAIILILLLYAAITKLADHDRFEDALRMSPLLTRYATLFAWGLPAIEIVIALLLFIPEFRLKGLYASLILLTSFTIYLFYMISFSPQLPCNCGGLLTGLTWRQHILLNIFFVLLSISGIYSYRRYKLLLSTGPP